MDNRNQTLLKLLSASKRTFEQGLAVKASSPRHLITKIIEDSGSKSLFISLSRAGLRRVENVSVDDVSYSEHAVFSTKDGFFSDIIFNSSLAINGPSYSPKAADLLSGAGSDLDWSRSYIAAELSSISQHGATSLFRSGDMLHVEIGLKSFPYRKLSVIECGFIAPEARATVEHPFLRSGLERLEGSMSQTTRPLFFVCGQIPANDVAAFFQKSHLPVQVITLDDFLSKHADVLSSSKSRDKKFVVVSGMVDSVALYASLRETVNLDLFMSSIGGVWSCQMLPKLCSKCKVTKKTPIDNRVEHGITLGGYCAENGGGCAHCLYGYSGVQSVDEVIDGRLISFFISAIERFEKKKTENVALQPLSLLTEYANDAKIESIYHVLSKHFKQLTVANSDAQLLLL